MKLLDEKGLTTVWAAIKNTFLTKSDASSYATKTEVENAKKWVSNSFMLLTGGTINGGIDLIYDNGTVHTQLDAAGITVSDSESDDQVEIHRNEIISPSFRIPYGTGDQVLVANGYTKEIGSANGIAGLDSNGYIPLDQLGNLDTTVAEVVTALPTTNIKKHIYLIKDANGTTQNQYAEYIYTGDTSATYDSSKWEKLGTYTATVDLTGYAKNKGVIRDSIDFDTETPTGGDPYMILKYAVGRDTNNQFSIAKTRVPFATTTQPGIMSKSDKVKLDGIATGANNYTLPVASANTLGGIKTGYGDVGITEWAVEVDNDSNAYVPIPGLYRDIHNNVYQLTVGTNTNCTRYVNGSISRDYYGSITLYEFPTKGGTFAMTSDISDLCKINFVDRPSNCVEGRINMFTTTDRSISLNNIQDYGEGLILLLGCYSDSQYTIYCTDSDLYYKGVLVDDGYREGITREGMYLVTIKGSSVYVYPLG